MARTRSSPWLRWAHARRRLAHDDFGDYGTAFGLELTLQGAGTEAGPRPNPAGHRSSAAGLLRWARTTWALWSGRWQARPFRER